MNRISLHFADSQTMFARVEVHGSGEHLIFYLKGALNHFEEEKRRGLARYGVK
jgi:hypothetical protein